MMTEKMMMKVMVKKMVMKIIVEMMVMKTMVKTMVMKMVINDENDGDEDDGEGSNDSEETAVTWSSRGFHGDELISLTRREGLPSPGSTGPRGIISMSPRTWGSLHGDTAQPEASLGQGAAPMLDTTS